MFKKQMKRFLDLLEIEPTDDAGPYESELNADVCSYD